MPIGIWQMTKFDKPERGQSVFMCFPPDAVRLAQARGYIGGGSCPDGSEMGLKVIAAVPGDEVVVSDDGIAVNGLLIENSEALPHDSANRPMTSLGFGTYRLGANEVWFVSGHDRLSYDSRYFGGVPLKYIQGKARPVLIQP